MTLPYEPSETSKLKEQVHNLKFTVERLTDRIAKLERDIAKKADKGYYYENWD